ncbi:MAG: oligosaccharide flippase family protein [Chloroflexota bacterium]
MKQTVLTESGSQSKQFAINVSANTAVMLFNTVIGLWFTPFLIRNLGVATYGIVILATSLTTYMSIFNTAIDNAIGRFLTIDIHAQHFDKATRTFNTALWSTLGISLGIIPIILFISYQSPTWFDVPVGQEQAARWLFALVMFSYLFVLLRSVFTASTFVHNRLDLKNIIITSNTVVRILVVVAFFVFFAQPQAWQVGVATLLGAILSLFLSLYIWRILTPELNIQLRLFDKTSLHEMIGMSGWLLINQVGSLLFLNIDLIVVNRYLGATAQGRYGSVLQLAIVLRTLAATVGTAITPIALAQYARRDWQQMTYMTRTAVKWMGLIMALPIGGIVGLSKPLLHVWLGAEFTDLAPLVVVLVAHLCVNLAIRPLLSIQTALNKVRWPGIITLLFGVINLLLAIWWVRWDTMGIGIALAGAIVLTIKNSIFTPIYGAYIQKLPWYTFLWPILPSLVGFVLVSVSGYASVLFWSLNSWFSLALVGIVLTILYLLLFIH